MTQSDQQQPTLGDRILADLESQLAEPDPRYARKCRELAMVRSQYAELMAFVQSKAEVLGLTTESSADSDVAPAEDEAPKVNGKVLPKDEAKSTK